MTLGKEGVYFLFNSTLCYILKYLRSRATPVQNYHIIGAYFFYL